MKTMREEFEAWYVENAFDYVANPIGSRDCGLQWKAWQAASKAMQERCAEICDKQHDRARTPSGAARADFCATRIRSINTNE